MTSPRKIQPADHAVIVEKAMMGQTQASIAAKYGVSRERIRQILVKYGKDQDAKLLRRAMMAADRVRSCLACGKDFTSLTPTKTYCSLECRRRNRAPTKVDLRNMRAYAMRCRGHRWLDVAREIYGNDHEVVAINQAKRYAGMAGAEWPIRLPGNGHRPQVPGHGGYVRVAPQAGGHRRTRI